MVKAITNDDQYESAHLSVRIGIRTDRLRVALLFVGLAIEIRDRAPSSHRIVHELVLFPGKTLNSA